MTRKKMTRKTNNTAYFSFRRQNALKNTKKQAKSPAFLFAPKNMIH